MNRRVFLKLASVSLGGAAITPFLQACSSDVLLSPTEVSSFSVANGPMAEYIASFAKTTNSRVIAEDVNDWLSTLGSSESAAVLDVNSQMAGSGFDTHDGYQVFEHSSGLNFYGIGNKNGYDACVPVFLGADRCALLERPAISGLSQAAHDWNTSSGVSVGDGLMTWQTYVENEHYGTPVGHHIHLSKPASGKIRVEAVHNNGGKLFDKTYAI